MTGRPTVLTITGSDGSGGSGVQADIRFMADLGAAPVSAVTCITVQNSLGIQEFYDLPADVVRRQVEALVNDVQPQVVKIGLIRSVETALAVADVLRRYPPRHVVYAPVHRSTRGDVLIAPDAVEAVRRVLLPLCSLVLEPSDLPVGERRHGLVAQLSSAVAVYLARGEDGDEALLHARTYLRELPEGYADDGSRSAELYNRFVDAVERYYARYADVAFYAEQLNVSPRYLAQVTRRVASRAPKAIIDGRLTAEIDNLLTTTSLPLKLIAQRLGFSSQTQLSRYYRKQRGIPPAAVRNRHMGPDA